jgi:hypothetical protein
MQSITRQCGEVTSLLERLQACLDRGGHVIPAREVDLAVYIARARELMGITGCAAEATVATDFHKSGRRTKAPEPTPIKLEANGVWIGPDKSRTWYPLLNLGQIPTQLLDEMQRRLDAGEAQS